MVAVARVTPPIKAPPITPQTDFGKKVRAHTRYYTADGERVPGVTTALGVLNKPQLVPWANRLGLEGIDSRAYTSEAAAVGTLAHALIECDLKGEVPDLSDFTPAQLERAMYSVQGFREWRAMHTLEPILVEEKLVSETYQYGGTLDCLGTLDGVLTLVDLKTSSGVYPEHVYQLGGYYGLLKEAGYNIMGARILRIGRTKGEGTEEHTITGQQILHGWQVFKVCLQLYRMTKKA